MSFTLTCRACSIRAQFTKRENMGRISTFSPQPAHEACERRRAEQRATPFQKYFARQADIEGSISERVCCHGVRRVRYRGQPKKHSQATALAAAINVVRIH